MKKTLFILSLLSVVPGVGLWEEAASAHLLRMQAPVPTSTAGATFARHYLPFLDLTLTDLDARDSDNRPLPQSAKQADLKQLFVENLYLLASVEAPHAMRETWTLLELFSRLFHNAFLNGIRKLADLVQGYFRGGSRRVVHNVHKLWITFTVGVSPGCLHFFNHGLPKPFFKPARPWPRNRPGGVPDSA